MRSFIKYFSFIAAAILTINAVITIAVWERALTPELYTDALIDSGVYTQSTNILEAKVTTGLQEVGKEVINELEAKLKEDQNPDSEVDEKLDTIIIWSLNTIIDSQTGTIVKKTSERMDVEGIMEIASANMIEYAIGWLRGDIQGPEVFQYIPTPEELEALKDENLTENAITGLVVDVLGFSDLPECKNRDAEIEALTQINNGNFFDVACTTDTVNTIIHNEVQSLIPEELLDTVKTGFDDFLANTGLGEVFDQVFKFVETLSVIKYNLGQFRTSIQLVPYLALLSFLFALPFLAIALYLTEENRIRAFIITYFAVGVIIVSISMITYLTAPKAIASAIPFDQISIEDNSITATQSALFVNSLEDAATMIAQGLYLYAFYIGFLIVILAGLGWILWTYIYKNNDLAPKKVNETSDSKEIENSEESSKKNASDEKKEEDKKKNSDKDTSNNTEKNNKKKNQKNNKKSKNKKNKK